MLAPTALLIVNAMEEYLEAIGESKRRDSVFKVTRLLYVSCYLVLRCSAIATMLRSTSVRTRRGFQPLTDTDTEMHSRNLCFRICV